MSEKAEISVHEVRIFWCLQAKNTWQTSKELATLAKVSPRTARHHLLRYVKLNLVDQAEVFPAHRYRLSAAAEKRNPGYLIRLKNAAEVFRGKETE